MKREILFRGIDEENGEWRFGSFVDWTSCGGDLEIMDTRHAYKVIPESVGQFTGLTDKNGVKIFEGDKLQCLQWEPSNYQVLFIEGSFCLGDLKTNEWIADVTHMEDSTGKHFEVIGNIHEPCKQY